MTRAMDGDSRIWSPTPATSIQIGEVCVMHGGPQSVHLPEHEHLETQVQSRFRRMNGTDEIEPLCSTLYAPGQPHRGRVENGEELIVLLLGPHLIRRSAGEIFSQDSIEIRPFSKERSQILEHLHAAVRDELRCNRTPSQLYLESIAHVVVGHILRHHADTGAARGIRGRFSAAQLRRIDRFIDENISRDFKVEELASVVKLGPQRFTQRFRQTMKVSPWRHVQARRLKRAQELLAGSNTPLSEIALSLGFCSQSRFTNTFTRWFRAPRLYRNGS